MVKINDVSTFPNTTPASDDHVIGTDVSDTTNSADGEVVTFTLGEIANLNFEASWHPYDMTSLGDGSDGKFYDYSVDGAVANFVTPDFEDGYEYAIKLDGLSFVNDGDPRLEAYLETSAAYDTAVALSATVTNNYVLSAKILLPGVRESLKIRHYILEYYYREALGVPTDLSSTDRGILSQDNTAQKITKIRISPPSGNTDAGKAYLYRRRNHTL